MLFYPNTPSKANVGMKFVLFEVTTDTKQIINDWGFADWLGDKWDDVVVPEGYECKVIWWANTVDPELLTKEKSKIITLGK